MDGGKVIAVTNQKGGVAKTTTAVNLGAGLTMDGNRVLLIDADPQSSLTLSLGIDQPDDLDVSLSTVMQDIMEDKKRNPMEGILRTGEGVWLMPSNILLSGTETALFNAMSRENILKNYIRKVKRQFDYVLIDCMPSLGMMTINALTAADSVIIPTQPNYLSAKGMDLLFRSIAKVRRSINPDLKIDGILMTMVDGRTNNARDIIAALRENVGQRIRIFDAEIPRSVRVAEASMRGESIFRHDPEGKVAEAYRLFVKEVERIGERDRYRSGDDRVR